MMTQPEITRYSSFIVRLWQESAVETPAIWCGEVESIQTGQKWKFDNLKTMFDLLQITILAEQDTPSSQENG